MTMVFNEVYSIYYQIVLEIIEKANKESITASDLIEIAKREGFGESFLTIEESIDTKWKILNKQKKPLVNATERPLTNLEKRWLKTISLDPRIKLFDVSLEGVEDVEPLFSLDSIDHFDDFTDGDAYESKEYQTIFRTIRQALHEHRIVEVSYISRKNIELIEKVMPRYLEYSKKDDKFRLVSLRNGSTSMINLGRIKECKILNETYVLPDNLIDREDEVVLEITDTEEALERIMMHFSLLEKKTEEIGENTYRMTLRFDRDETLDILIRILSFGPIIKVIEPVNFKEKIKERIMKQELL